MLLIFPVLLLGYLLLGLAISIGVARWSGRRFRSRIAPWVVFPVLFLLFFGDEIYGYWHWQHLCETEGGLHVYKRVPVEGFFKDGNIGIGAVREYLKSTYGGRSSLYGFVEGKENNRFYRYRAGPGGEFDIQVEAIDRPSSFYAMSEQVIFHGFHHAWLNERSIYNLGKR